MTRAHTLIFDCPRGAAAALAARPPGCAWPEVAMAVAGARLEIRAGADRVARLLAHDWGGTAELAAWLAPADAGAGDAAVPLEPLVLRDGR